MLTVYGIKNCDTCRKARKWLNAEGVEHTFHDLRVDGFDAANVSRWLEAVGWEKLLNRRGMTWRNLDESDKDRVDAAKAATLMAGNPTLIKRPVFDDGRQILVGFTVAEQKALKA